ncbi:MAG TPA: hypothetical protein VNW29_04350 [Candidatus Sulfotelmatobacter sp.]|jgi:hypothetical protein|nr:hypothetical protein [Candidatus Sulfotelmatobacter sp.]
MIKKLCDKCEKNIESSNVDYISISIEKTNLFSANVVFLNSPLTMKTSQKIQGNHDFCSEACLRNWLSS